MNHHFDTAAASAARASIKRPGREQHALERLFGHLGDGARKRQHDADGAAARKVAGSVLSEFAEPWGERAGKTRVAIPVVASDSRLERFGTSLLFGAQAQRLQAAKARSSLGRSAPRRSRGARSRAKFSAAGERPPSVSAAGDQGLRRLRRKERVDFGLDGDAIVCLTAIPQQGEPAKRIHRLFARERDIGKKANRVETLFLAQTRQLDIGGEVAGDVDFTGR